MTTLIRSVFEEMDIPKRGTAYEDEALNNLYLVYQKPKAIYYVAELQGTLVGGAGISALESGKNNICELQKMYVANSSRGAGIGQDLIRHCLTSAKQLGYSGCYLETMPNMKAAQHLYQKNGFGYKNAPLGRTGHTACQVYMYKDFS